MGKVKQALEERMTLNPDLYINNKGGGIHKVFRGLVQELFN